MMSEKRRSVYHVNCVILALILAAGCSYQNCVLPEHPSNGKLAPFEDNCPEGTKSAACQGIPGTRVTDGWFLFVYCDDGFVLDTGEHKQSLTTCADGKWSPPLPSCVYNLTNDKDKCVAPPYPQNGKYTPLPIECAITNKAAESLVRPGAFLPSSCVLLYSCNDPNQLSDNDVIQICDKGQWIPNSMSCGSHSTQTEPTVDHRPIQESKGEGCVLPQPQNRKFCPFECTECHSQYSHKCSFAPGSLVTERVIRVQCSAGYRLASDQDFSPIVCVNGTWKPEFPKCLKLCPPLESDSVFAACQYGATGVDCSKPMLPGTTATYHCKPSHAEYPSLTTAGVYKRTLACRNNGKWSNSLPECEPACGVSKGGIKVSPTVVDGSETPLGAFPWHAGLYRLEETNWNYICGGSLISNRVVLTAAHCVDVLRPSQLQVGLGKFYKAWSIEEKYAIKSNVSAIQMPREYSGALQTYAWDIALLLLRDKVQINSFVMPVCRDENLALRVSRSTVGYIVGWGKTHEGGKESEILLHTNFSILDYGVCFRKLPKTLAFDKFCGVKNAVSVAESGDSGGGVTTVSNDLHFVIGIISFKTSHISVFTNVSYHVHKSWIEKEMRNFDKEINSS